jgi:hypothetical protein
MHMLTARQLAKAFSDLSAARPDRDFFYANYNELEAKYPDRFVAVQNQEVIVVASSYDGLSRELAKKGIPIGKVLIEFLPDPDAGICLGS